MVKQKHPHLVFNVIFPVLVILLTILTVVIPIAQAMQGKNCVKNTIIEKNGSQITGYAMEDILNIGYFEYVNHFPNQYVDPLHPATGGKIESVQNLTKAPFGSIQFVIFNYDKNDPNFIKNINESPFWSPSTQSNLIAFHIPFGYDCASIWNNGEYYSTNGKMQNYDWEQFNHSPLPIRGDFQVKKPSKMIAMLPDEPERLTGDKYEDAYVITFHYQAKRGAIFKNNIPTFGNALNVTQATSVKYSTTLTSIMLIVCLLLSAFAIMLLKVSLHKLPYIGIVFSALLIDIGQFMSLRYDVISSKILVLFSVAAMVAFTIIACKPDKPKLKIFWICAVVLSILNVIISTILGIFVDYNKVVAYSRVIYIILIISEYVLAFFKLRHTTIMEFAGIVIALTVPILAMFFNFSLIWYINPTCLVANISSIVFIYNIIETIRSLETKNKTLTDNLMAEVTAQTHNLHSALQDRELLLSFISHDLRKSSIVINNLANKIVQDKDRINSPIAQKIIDKNELILTSLGDISKYMKQNFSSEPFEVVKVNEIFNDIEKSLGPDCEAYGIKLTCVDSNKSIRVKKVGLISVLNNLIFNAIEHAECKNIVLSSAVTKKGLDIYVHDDGKGIDNVANVFSPYVTSGDTESNMGLGLFIVKSEIESMGGSINYQYDDGSTFIISLLKEFD